MPLTKKEKEELEFLDNPDIQFLASPLGLGSAFSVVGKHGRHRKERVVELRTKMRMEKLGLTKAKDSQKYHKIVQEEKQRFDERFNAEQIGCYNNSDDDFVCVECAKKQKEFDSREYKAVRRNDLKDDIFTCDKCGKEFN